MQPSHIFQLPRKPEQLKNANEGFANAHYRQISATKDVTGNQFSQGVQQFRFDTSGNTWFLPSMSYFRLRCSLQHVREDQGPALPPLSNADLAPNMGLAANLFKSVEVRLNGHTVERISERVPQIDALKTRMSNTRGWLDTVGKTTNFWDPDFASRRAAVAVDGYETNHRSWAPEYGPALTQAEAGFHANHLIAYNSATYVFQVDPNGQFPVDLRHGPMALRPGDRLTHGANVLEITQIVDARRGMANFVQSDQQGRDHIRDGNQDPPAGVNGWTIQKLKQARGNRAVRKNQFEIVWRPPLGLFELPHAIPPGGQWMIEFNPANPNDCRKNVVESLLDDLQSVTHPSIAGQFDFRVDEFQFYVYLLEAERFDRGTWFLDVPQTRCQLQSMPPDCTSLVQKNFDVHGKTTQLTLAFQDQAEGSDTRRSKSKFKIRPVMAEEKEGHAAEEGQELLLERFFINYGQEQKPTPDFDGRFQGAVGTNLEPQTNYLVHRYVDSLMHAGLFHTEGGAESFDEWLQRGPYYHFRWPKDATESSTRVSVNFKFSQPFADQQQHQVMLFSQWRSAYKITHNNGRVDIASLQEL